MLVLRSSLLLALACATLSSCADEKPAPSTVTQAEAFLTPAPSLAEAVVKAKNARIECAPGATCSPSVGLLSFALQTNAAQCTATLVAPDIVATNAHCVPPELQKKGAPCRGRIWMNFLKNENPNFETQIECAEVLMAEGAGKPDAPDYAFLRLAKASSRPALRVSRQGIENEEMIRIEKVDPIKGEGVSGRQYEVTCVAKQHTMLADFNDKYSPVPLIADCELIRGNSGSALRAADGSLRGVIFGVLDVNALGSLLAETNKRLSGDPGPLAVGTNFGCLALPNGVNAGPRPAVCIAPRAKNQSIQASDAAHNKALTEYVKTNQANAPAFRWFDFTVVREPKELILQPKCVMPRAPLGQEAIVGDLNFVPDVVVDAYTRFESFQLRKRDRGPLKALITSKAANGNFAAVVNGKSLSLPACP